MSSLMKQFYAQRDPAHPEKIVPYLTVETPSEEEAKRRGAELRAWTIAHGFPDPATESLEDFRKRAGLPAPSAAEVEAYEKERARMAGA